MENGIALQYEWVKDARAALFAYCETVSPDDFVKPLDGFGGGSMRGLLVHVANVYEFWLGRFVHPTQAFTKAETINQMAGVRHVYAQVDGLVSEFYQRFRGEWEGLLIGTSFSADKNITATPFKLFTHVITHEFHHKGQILSMSRHLGYIPPDTDVIRFV